MEHSLKYHPCAKSDPNKHDQNMVTQLKQAGVNPEEGDIVVLTHLHWDHLGDVMLFPNA